MTPDEANPTRGYVVSVQSGASTDRQILLDGLIAHNAACAGPANRREVSVFLRDADENIAGGACGILVWEWLFVNLLWVREDARGQGNGRTLMSILEQEAAARGCSHAYLDTFSFQARGFYEKIGYQVFGQLMDFPQGHTRFFLQKRFLDADDSAKAHL